MYYWDKGKLGLVPMRGKYSRRTARVDIEVAAHFAQTESWCDAEDEQKDTLARLWQQLVGAPE